MDAKLTVTPSEVMNELNNRSRLLVELVLKTVDETKSVVAIEINKEGTVTWASSRSVELLGIHAGDNISKIMSDADEHRHREAFASSLGDPSNHKLTTNVRCQCVLESGAVCNVLVNTWTTQEGGLGLIEILN